MSPHRPDASLSCPLNVPSRPWHAPGRQPWWRVGSRPCRFHAPHHAAPFMHDPRAATVPPSHRHLPAWLMYTGSPPTSHPRPSMPRHHHAQAEDLMRGLPSCRISLHFAICALPVGSVNALSVSHTPNLPHRTYHPTAILPPAILIQAQVFGESTTSVRLFLIFRTTTAQ
jgi:hypothetical protein